MGKATPRIFLSYRREDTAHVAGRLMDRLVQSFGNESIFLDIDSLEPGDDFFTEIEGAVISCDVLLVVIGPYWLEATNARGRRRLDDPNDFVFLEVRAALTRDIPVIPLLVDGASMPRPALLPEELQPLAKLSALPISSGSFRADEDALIRTLEKIPRRRRTPASRTTEAGGRGQGQPPMPGSPVEIAARRESTEYLYDVALSYASEQRSYVEAVAEALRSNGIKVFFDRFEQARLWGTNLYDHLDHVYQRDARYCILFASSEYAAKTWPSHEREAAQARALQEKGDAYILPARFDDTEIPGLPASVGYIDATKVGPEQLAELFIEKVGLAGP